MSKQGVLWIGEGAGLDPYRCLRRAMPHDHAHIGLHLVDGGRQALEFLAQESVFCAIAVIDLDLGMRPLSELVNRIHELNPALEVIVLASEGQIWQRLELRGSFRPILIDPATGEETLVSCLAKLWEMSKLKDEFASRFHQFQDRIAMSRKNQESLLALLYRQVGVGIITMRIDGFLTFFNPEARRLTGYTQHEMPHISRLLGAMLDEPEQASQTIAKLGSFWNKGAGGEEMILRVHRENGQRVTLSLSVLMLMNQHGESRQMVLLIHDPMELAEVNEYGTLVRAGGLSLYTYYTDKGFVRITEPAVDLINRAFGLNLEATGILGRKIQDLPLPGETVQTWNSMIAQVSSGSDPVGDLPVMGGSGKRILGHSFLAPLRHSQPGDKGVLAVLKAREDLSAASYEHLSFSELAALTLRDLPQPFLLFKAQRNASGAITDLRCLGGNLKAGTALGWQSGDETDKSLAALFPDPLAGKQLFEHGVALAENGGEVSLELDLFNPHEPDLHQRFRFWLGKVGDGVALFFSDVTQKRQEERLLKQYRHTFDHMQESIVVTDLDGRITDWNPASEKMFGFTRDEMLGQSVFQLTRDAGGGQLEQETRNILRDGDVWKGDYQFIRADGSRGMAISTLAILRDDEGRAYGTVGLHRDVTDRRRLEERLRLKTHELQEKNIALSTLLHHAEEERRRISRQVAGRLEQIADSEGGPQLARHLSRLLLADIGQVTADPGLVPAAPAQRLTEKEIEVARLIRGGKTTEEIAFILDKSPDTVRLQRISLRKKLGLVHRDQNLARHLKDIDIID